MDNLEEAEKSVREARQQLTSPVSAEASAHALASALDAIESLTAEISELRRVREDDESATGPDSHYID